MARTQRLRKRGMLVLTSGCSAAALLAAQMTATASTLEQSPTAAAVPIRASLEEALDVSEYLMTPAQQAAVAVEQLRTNQNLIDRVVDLLNITDTVQPVDDGFSGLVVNPATAEMNLWWRGDLPTAVRTVLDTLTLPVQVQVHQAEYSRKELVDRILATKSRWDGIEMAVPKEDGSGVVLLLSQPDANIDEVGAAMGVPTEASVEGEQIYTEGGRQNSTAPWWGGAMMHRHDQPNSSGFCSTGFAVLKGSTGYLLSAAHCDTSADHRWDNGNLSDPTRIATAANVWVVLSMDSMLMNPDNGTRGKVHTGGFTGGENKKVRGSAVNNVGDSVATDGANSGNHSSQTIFNDAFDANCNGYNCTAIAAGGPDRDYLSSVGGDSGGPVLHHYSGTHVTAKGIIKSALANWWANCDGSDYQHYPGDYYYDGNYYTNCSYRTIYMPIRPLLGSDVWNATLETME